jgi:hypothetical protein
MNPNLPTTFLSMQKIGPSDDFYALQGTILKLIRLSPKDSEIQMAVFELDQLSFQAFKKSTEKMEKLHDLLNTSNELLKSNLKENHNLEIEKNKLTQKYEDHQIDLKEKIENVEKENEKVKEEIAEKVKENEMLRERILELEMKKME